jgi:hypothetical protein
MTMADGMLAVMRFFEMNPAEFKAQWTRLSDEEKLQLKTGIGSYDEKTGVATGSLTY